MTDESLQRFEPLIATKILNHAFKSWKGYFKQLDIDFRRKKEVTDHRQEGPYRAGGGRKERNQEKANYHSDGSCLREYNRSNAFATPHDCQSHFSARVRRYLSASHPDKLSANTGSQ